VYRREGNMSYAEPILKDSPQPQETASGLWKTNLADNLSSFQSISLPMMLNSALLSINTVTSSCLTRSSNLPASSGLTYSR